MPAKPTPPIKDYLQDSAKVEALFASIGEGIIVTDEVGKITRINQAALQMLDYKISQVLHRRFVDKIVAVHEDGSLVSVIDRPIIKAFLTGEAVTTSTFYRKNDNSLLPVHLTVSPLKLRGQPIGAIEVFRDITSEIQAEKMKTDFISLASHQLRTPLSSINIYSRMLQDGLAGKLNKNQQAYVQIILGSVERMNELISTLLNVTRIEAGNITVKTSKINLVELVHEILGEFMPAIDDAQLNLELAIDDNLPLVKTDSLLVKEVCANLLSNAIKYTPPGGKISVILKSTKNSLIFSVADTGYGIPKGAQKQVFSKFFRADNIAAQDVSGTGLGLYLIKAIAENLSGDLWFESIEGQGSTFYFSLPIHGSISRQGKFRLGL